ncbi:MAG: 16S rRNA (cytosine(1402)-N(4))-methyltransferase RsmH [Actinobacteria bacterium]|nr:16S rRNA (cytosine(1402)-N(4))-methyltransferase RsmH [Actinomycetota bacterium]
MEYEHKPVLLAEALHYLRIRSGSTVVDCTLGGAGHAEAILDLLGSDGVLVGIDKDDAALKAARARLAGFSQQIKFMKGGFEKLDRLLPKAGVLEVDAFLFDLGVSSYQFDRPERGFSYRFEAPLDMRMDLSQKLTAADVVNGYSEKELAGVIRRYGEERWASKIAGLIVRTRQKRPIKTTFDLVAVVKDAVPAPARRRGGHPAKRTFQAIRIEVNGELEAVEAGLSRSINWLKPGGRVVVISYHSLEDRIVKRTFADLARGCLCPPELPVCICGKRPMVKILTKKAVRPTDEELRANPRASSARLRAAEKVGD